MHHFILVVTNSRNEPIDVRIIDTPVNAAGAQILPHSFNGNRTSADAYREQLLAHYGLTIPATQTGRERVSNVTTGETFKSAAEAARSIGVSTSAVTRHMRDYAMYPHVRGYVFQRLDGDNNATAANIRQRVHCVETGLTYGNVVEAASVFGVTAGHMRRHLNTPAKEPTVIGYTLRWCE